MSRNFNKGAPEPSLEITPVARLLFQGTPCEGGGAECSVTFHPAATGNPVSTLGRNMANGKCGGTASPTFRIHVFFNKKKVYKKMRLKSSKS